MTKRCFKCGEAKPLDVRWLCVPCHATHHLKYDREEDEAILSQTG